MIQDKITRFHTRFDTRITKCVLESDQMILLIWLKVFLQKEINVRTGFLDPKNLSKDTKISFRLHILRTLLDIEDRAHLCRFVFCSHNGKVAVVYWSDIHLFLIHDTVNQHILACYYKICEFGKLRFFAIFVAANFSCHQIFLLRIFLLV